MKQFVKIYYSALFSTSLILLLFMYLDVYSSVINQNVIFVITGFIFGISRIIMSYSVLSDDNLQIKLNAYVNRFHILDSGFFFNIILFYFSSNKINLLISVIFIFFIFLSFPKIYCKK